MGAALVLDFSGLGGRDLAGDLHLALGLLLDLLLLGHVNLTAMNRRLKRVGRHSAAIRVDVHLRPVGLARLAAGRRLALHRLAADDGRHLVVSLFRLLRRVIPIWKNLNSQNDLEGKFENFETNLQFGFVALGHALCHGTLDDLLARYGELVRSFSQFHLLVDDIILQLDKQIKKLKL